MECGANHALHFGLGCRGGLFQARVHNVGGKLFVGFDRNGKIAVAAAGFNVKTHDFVGDEGFLFGLRNDALVPNVEFVTARGLLLGLGFNGVALDLDPARRTDVLDVEVAQQGRDVGFVDSGVVVAVRMQPHFIPLAIIPQILHLVHDGHVFEFQHQELVVLAAVKPVQRLAAKELALVRQNGVLAEFSDRLFQIGDEVRLGFKAPRLGHLDVKEGLVIADNDGGGFTPLVDPEHLYCETFFVLAELFVSGGTTAGSA